MSIDRTRFLGLTVRSFNTSLGWGGQPSTLSVGLVDDPVNGDAFTYPNPGEPVVFQFNGYEQRGIVQDYKYSKSGQGLLWDVNITDPRELLSGVSLVVGSYTGSTNFVKNVINCFGYYEGVTFGSSQANESGMPWRKIKNAITAIVNSTVTSVNGGPITLGGWSYSINLDSLPNVPDDFRIGGDVITLMDFINEVCEAGACDYFFTLESGNWITLSTISRLNPVVPGAIYTYINSLSEVVSSEIGLEFRNEPVGRVVVGANRQDIYFQTYQAGTSGVYNDDTIWPFWGIVPPGYGNAGDVVLGTDINDDHVFMVDARHINLNYPGVVVNTYTMCVGELRAALESQSSWEAYLWWRNHEDPAALTTGGNQKYTSPTAQLYYQRAEKLGLIGNVNKDFVKLLGVKHPNSAHEGPFTQAQLTASSMSYNTEKEEEMRRLYSLVQAYASEYYGKKFMVRLPQVESHYDSETRKVTHNVEPADAGYLDESVWDDAYANNLIPEDINVLTNQEDMFEGYARYDDAAYLDFSEVSPNDIVYNSGGYSAFVKCDVEPHLAFLNYRTQYSPRAVVTVRGAVRTKPIGSGTNYYGLLAKFVNEAKTKEDDPITDAEADVIYRQFSADQIGYGNLGMIVQPNMVAVPLISNISRYGPWYSYTGANGKVEVEIDNELAPWNYGGYHYMNLAASGKVVNAISNMQQSETGSFEVPGAPAFSLGSALVAGGPYVTDMVVSVDATAGVTTRYVMSTWSPRFGSVSKTQQDKIQRISKQIQSQKRFNRNVVRKAQQAKPARDANGFITRVDKTPRKDNKSTHTMMVGENIYRTHDENLGYDSNVGIQPAYLTGGQLHPDVYQNKAGVSLDAMFRPFTTLTNSGYSPSLAHYQVPTSGAEFPTITDLDPYQSGFDFGVVIRGYSYPESLRVQEGGYDESGYYRGMGLRAPLVLVGWGYDVDGKPVPNLADPVLNSGLYAESGLLDEFWPGYLYNSQSWKAGPLDARYDYSRGLWVAGGGGGTTKIVKVVNGPSGFFPTEFQRVYSCETYTPSFNPVHSGVAVELELNDSGLLVGNFRQNIVISGSYYTATRINGQYYLDNQIDFL